MPTDFADYPEPVYVRGMVKFNLHLSEPQDRGLRLLAQRTGLSLAELIRRAVEEHLKREKAWLRLAPDGSAEEASHE